MIALITINFDFLFCMLLPPSFLLRDGFEPHRQKRHVLLYYKQRKIGSLKLNFFILYKFVL